MILNNMKIHNRLILSFCLIIILTVLIGVFALIEISDVGQTVKNMYDHPFTVSTAVLRIQSNINGMHRSMKDVAIAESSEEREKAISLVNRIERYVLMDFDIIEERFLGEVEKVVDARNAFENWAFIRLKVIESSRNNMVNEAADITRNEGAEYVEMLSNKIQTLTDFAMGKAEDFKNEARHHLKQGIVFILITMFIISLVSFLIAAWIISSIRNPLYEILKGIKKIEMGQLDYTLDFNRKDEIGIIAESFEKMVENLKHKSEVLEKIAEGDLSKKVELKSEKDTLAMSINSIIDSFSYVVSQADSVASGNFSEDLVLRSENDRLGISISNMLGNLRDIVGVADKVASGDFRASLIPKSDNDELSDAVNRMIFSLGELSRARDEQNWLKTGQAELGKMLQGDMSIEELSQNTLRFLAGYIDGDIGCIYLSEDSSFHLTGSYAMTYRKDSRTEWKTGEGIVGQAALEKEMIVLWKLPDDYMPVTSGTGSSSPSSLVVLPCITNNEVKVIIEIGFFSEVTEIKCEFLRSISNTVAIAFLSAESKRQTKELLKQTREQSETLKQQQGELIAANEELEIQTGKLRSSEEELKSQQEELLATNEELEKKTRYLEEQKEIIAKVNTNLEEAGLVLEEKARELEQSSRYKSEFLANMSHELRTPLNSLLILAQDLKENRDENLTDHQKQAAEIIHRSGNELLKLINEILDLSKIEAGKMELHTEKFPLQDILDSMLSSFKRLAEEKGIHLMTHLDEAIDPYIISDRQRIEQIFRNIISNGLKFTEEGSVSFIISKPDRELLDKMSWDCNESCILFTVTDTGIGIPEEKQRYIFEAFHQVDGSISRKYGGTGLGLSIVRELVKLLGGKLSMSSHVNEGTEVSVLLPANIDEGKDSSEIKTNMEDMQSDPVIINPSKASRISDDRNEIFKGDKSILVIEDDCSFAEILRDFSKSYNLKFLHAPSGEQGIELAEKYMPGAIILDITLPGKKGWAVLENLKENVKTRHIPVHMVSADDENLDAYRKGAIGYLTKPVSRDQLEGTFSRIESLMDKKMSNLLVVEDNDAMRTGLKQLITGSDINTVEASSGTDALELIENNNFDCVILDLGLPDMSGFDLLKKIGESRNIIEIPPVIVYTGMDITREQESELEKYASSIIVKGVKSRERLLDEASLFLHRVIEDMPEHEQQMINMLHNRDLQFEGKKILIVDDDMRNVFALGKVLEDNRMEVFKAANGLKALEVLEQNPDIDLILMDIMMPVMDGFQAMEKIREQKQFRTLPIIAVTAKAMKEDQDKCFESGANDYIAKPVDIDRLLSLIRLWLY